MRQMRIAPPVEFLRYLVAQTRSKFWVALGLLVLGGLTEGLSILMIIPLLSLLGTNGTALIDLPTGMFGALRMSLPQVLAILVALICLQALFTRYKNIYLVGLLFGFMNRVRLDLFATIGSLRWDFLSRQRPSDLHHLLTADVERIYTASFAVMRLVQTGVLLLIYLAVSWIVSPWMTLLAGGLGLVTLVILAPLRRRATRFGEERTVNKRSQYRTVSEFLGGLKTTKIHNAEEAYLGRLAENADAVQREAVGYVRLTSLGTVVSQVVSAGAVAVLVYAGVVIFETPIARLITFMLVLMRISPRFMGLQTNLQDVLSNLGVFEAVKQFRKTAAPYREASEANDPAPVPPLKDALRFENVTFAHGENSDRPALNDVSLAIPAGCITALIGPSGSGKSTLADLASGLLTPRQGELRIDGNALTPEAARAWRRQVAYMPQEPFLLHDSVAANLRLARPEASESAMWDALEMANAASFVRDLPQGLHTTIGENGALLSGGQRQRIALARALIMDPQLLILDEATSALDWESQALIAKSIEQLRGRTTVLAIAHRPSSIAGADWIIALENGRVAEAGSFADLSQRSSTLSRMISAEAGQARPSRELLEKSPHV